MSKDVKVEILYYKSTSDISLEFGLHGKYPMRLLSSDCKDINSFFQSLKRAVSRSEIIITIGGFDQEDNLPMFIARAVGLNCEIPNLLKQNIITDKDYCLPKGSIALAPKSRRFGGFLLECGPQAIISLTDERKVRQDIVEEFLVNYITEHHKVFSTPNIKAPVTDSENEDRDIEPIETKEPEVNTQLEGITDVSPETGKDVIAEMIKTEVVPETETEFDENLKSTVDDIDSSLPAEPDEGLNDHVLDSDDYDLIADRVKKLTLTNEVENFIDDINDDQPEIDNDGVFDRHLTRRRKRLVRAVCLILSLLIIISTFFGYWISTAGPKTFDLAEYYKSLHNVYYSYQNDNLADAFDLVKSQNSNFFTWLCFEDIDIDHPVLTVSQTADYQRYLTALPDGSPDKNGTVFSTSNSSLNNVEHNAVIFGNALDGGIFSSIKNNLFKTLVGKNISTADSRYYSEWTVFSVFSKERTSDFDNTSTSFATTDEYVEYLNNIKNSSNKNNKSLTTFRGNEKVIVLVGVADSVDYCIAAKLVSVTALYGSNADSDDTSSDTMSSDNSSSDTVSNPDDVIPDSELDHTGNDFMGDSPDIVIPLPPVTSSSSPSSSSVVSSATSSSVSSSEKPSSSAPTSTEISSSTSADTSSVTSVPSNTESTSSEPSTTTPSTTPSVSSSEVTSITSSVTSSTVKPDVDPIYTWDIELSCIDSATGVKYTDTAVKIVAMIIEDEMSPTVDPPEALIAQAIVKYNWLLNNNGRNPDKAPKNALDPNPTKQAIEYATAAKGKLLLYGNTIAKTYCYAYSAGKTANYQDIWGGTAYPYLQSVDCPVDEELKDFITSNTYSAEDIKKLISEKCGVDVSSMPKTEWIKAVKYDNNNLYCVTVSIGGKEYKGTYLRDSLLSYGIRSSAYTIAYNETDDTFTFTCKGYGHGVGFSQRGAKAYAKQGWDHAKILAHFFPGTTLISH
ncbi:MAG: SpoIID/LytB domain-containing protein [Clostridia bacterium]|nr:SpoIID/LytB domain-containing protein [Clostridia bacterium]